LFRKSAREITRSGPTRAAAGLTTLTGLYLGGRWQSGLFDDVFAATFFLLGTVLVGAAIVTADVLPRWRDNRMLLLHGALPVGLGRQAAIVLGLSLVVVAGLAAALLAGLGMFTSLSRGCPWTWRSPWLRAWCWAGAWEGWPALSPARA